MPTPPEPVPTTVIVVPGAMPGPVIVCPTCRTPDVMLLTLSVVPTIVPVKTEVAGASVMVSAPRVRLLLTV